MRARSDETDSGLTIPEPLPSDALRGTTRTPSASDSAAQVGRLPRRRSRPWSVLDLIWSFGDYSSTDWSAKSRIEPSIVVAAHDGVTLNQFLIDLTKAILDGQGWEFLLHYTRFDGSCYVLAETRSQYPDPGSEDPDGEQQPPFRSGDNRATRRFPAA